jgi:hypothetical protein
MRWRRPGTGPGPDLAAPARAPPPRRRTRRTVAEARDLAGRCERFAVELASHEWEQDGYRYWECEGGGDVSRTAWVPAGQHIAGPHLIVEGQVSVKDWAEGWRARAEDGRVPGGPSEINRREA